MKKHMNCLKTPITVVPRTFWTHLPTEIWDSAVPLNRMELAVWLQMLRIPGLNAMSSGSNGTSRGGESPCGYSPSFSVSSRAHGELGSHMGTEIQKQMIGVLLLPKVAVCYLTNYLPKTRNVHLSPKNSERIVFTDKPSMFQSENSALQAHQQMSLNKGTLTSSSSALQN